MVCLIFVFALVLVFIAIGLFFHAYQLNSDYNKSKEIINNAMFKDNQRMREEISEMDRSLDAYREQVSKMDRQLCVYEGHLYKRGDKVRKCKGRFTWQGTVVCAFVTSDKEVSYVVEHKVDEGYVLHIYTADQLERIQ